EVLKALRESGNDLPVVIITAHGNVTDAVLAMKLGAIDFLAKPLAPDTLRAVVAEVIARHEPSGPRPAKAPEPVSIAGQFSENLTKAKRALNRRTFEEAEV